MIGNDVIDLALARKESNWRRPGFIEKIFTLSEQEFIGQAKNPEVAVWHLWSCKEAVYKIVNRESGERIFNPQKFQCFVEINKVKYNNNQYFTGSIITKNSIHTIAVKEPDLLEHVIRVSAVDIQKINGIPYYQNAPASVSHHGRFIEIVALGYNPSLALSLRKSSARV